MSANTLAKVESHYRLWFALILLIACFVACRRTAPTPAAPPAKEKSAARRPARQIPASFRVLSSDHFRLGFPKQISTEETETALRVLEQARADMSQRLAAAEVSLDAMPQVEIVVYATTGDFVAATGENWWAGGVTNSALIELQPLATLRQRDALETTLRHEYAHAVSESLRQGATPRWLNEGVALYFAGEGRALAQVKTDGPMALDELEKALAGISSADEQKRLYAAAYQQVSALRQTRGESALWRLALGLEKPKS